MKKFIMNIPKFFVYVVAIFLFSIVGCTKNFDTLNTPENLISTNKIDEGLIGQMFANAVYNAPQGDQESWQIMHELHAEIYSQIFSITSSGFDTDQFLEVGGWVDLGWNGFYANCARQNAYVLDYTKKNGMMPENAVANIVKVLMWLRVTDFWGPVIYSDFGKGGTSVAYDSQESIYHDFFTVLDASVNVLSQNLDAKPFGNNDLIFEGDAKKWIVFANSLKLRIAMRIVYADPALAKQEAENAVAAGVMISNQDNGVMSVTVNSPNLAAIWSYIDPFTMSATSESLLIGFNDPRLKSFFNEGGGRLGGNMGYHGVRNGLPRYLKTSDVRNGSAGNSFVSNQFLPIADGGTNPPFPVLTAAEFYFCRAEGALRGWNMGGTSEELYNEGIRQSLKYWTDATDAEIETYVTSTNTPSAVPDGIVHAVFNTPPVSDITVLYDMSGNFERQLEQIITQKWLDHHINGCECWAERRRTGYPRGYAIISSLDPAIPVTAIVRRVTFAPVEFSNNDVEVQKAISLLGGPDKTTTRLWWDKKPLSDYPDLSGSIVNLP
jgi:hypothetical protein